MKRSRTLEIPAMKPPPHNAHYEGSYDERMLEWRRLGAIDKSENIVSLLGARASEINSVLDVGCGTGAVLVELGKLLSADKLVGVDVVDPVAHADPHVAQCDIELVRNQTADLPFADDSFDLVFASHVLEHVEDQRGFLKELKRVARKYIYIEVPCELNLRTNPSSLQHTLTAVGHINCFTPDSLAVMLATSDLDMIEIQAFDHGRDLQIFDSSPLAGRVKSIVRSSLLGLNPRFATKLFTYHAGALCKAD